MDSMSGQCAVIVEGVDGQLSLGHVETEMISAPELQHSGLLLGP